MKLLICLFLCGVLSQETLVEVSGGEEKGQVINLTPEQAEQAFRGETVVLDPFGFGKAATQEDIDKAREYGKKLGPYEKAQVISLAKQRTLYKENAKIWKNDKGNIFILGELHTEPGVRERQHAVMRRALTHNALTAAEGLIRNKAYEDMLVKR